MENQYSLPPIKPFDSFKWRWAVTTPSESINSEDIILGVLKILVKHNGNRHATNEFKNDLHQLQTSINAPIDLAKLDRDINKNIIENSGQYWKALGLLNTTSDGTISVSDLGLKWASGEISNLDFIRHLYDNFKLPNQNIENADVVEQWNNAGLEIFPIKLLFETLFAITEKSISPSDSYITPDELKNIVVPLSIINGITPEFIANKILEYRSNEEIISGWPDCTPGDNDFRMLKEYLIFLANFDFLNCVELKDKTKRYYLNEKSFNLLRKMPKAKSDMGDSETSTSKKSKYPLNQILYGPPGTGKTYNVINHALSIIKNKSVDDIPRELLKAEFDDLVNKGQIQFVTFHQSYSYEEFVEGIKPVVNTNGNVEYHIIDGIFKKICNQAKKPDLIRPGETFSNSRGAVFSITKANAHIFEVTREDGSIITFPEGLITELLFLLRNGTITLDIIQSREKDGTPLQELLNTKYDKYIFGYDSVLRPFLEYLISKNIHEVGNYVLIIDEINRGNISKIFGELITLIEDSKRIGNSEELLLKLTYSGANQAELFGVPNNLYIIGTLNSTDRSIALIDTALRRRFTFYSYKPQPEILSTTSDGIDLNMLLNVINSRIEFLLDKDHLLGHAYFLNVENKDDLCVVLRNKLIPLLEEYFYGDYYKIQLVLGDKGFNKPDAYQIIKLKTPTDEMKKFRQFVDGFDDKDVFEIDNRIENLNLDKINAEYFISIYKS